MASAREPAPPSFRDFFLVATRFDLFGNPVAENHGKPGANGHVPDAKSVNKVRLLVMAGWASAAIAEEMGITVPTLNKHYFRNGSIKAARKRVLAETKGRNLMQIAAKADEGNVSAMKELRKIIEKEELSEKDKEARSRPAKAEPKLGKKEARAARALEASGSAPYLPDLSHMQTKH